MPYAKSLPIFVNLDGEHCIVVGGGAVATRKIDSLLASSARVTVFSPLVSAPITAMIQAGKIVWQPRSVEREDLVGARIVYCATDDTAVNEAVFRWCEELKVLVNCVDDVARSRFFSAAVVDRYPLRVAIGTDGASPLLSRLVKTRLEAILPVCIGQLAGELKSSRHEIKQRFPTFSERKKAYADRISSFFTGGASTHGAAARRGDALGRVFLVGAGPGDPELLTLKALRLLQAADVVLVDRLVSDEIVRLIRPEATIIDVGKEAGAHSCSQREIHEAMFDWATRVSTVVRLKGGDPFVFGRGGEELAELTERGITVTIVPGVTAAAGCAAYTGIPLTHRELSHSVTFISGQSAEHALHDYDWALLARPSQTLVVYMGTRTLGHIGARLREHGRAPETPVAIVSRGTRHDQSISVTTLGAIETMLEDESVPTPALVIIGEVVSLRHEVARDESVLPPMLAQQGF